MLMTRMTPKMRASPSATIAYSAPERIPDTTTCPIMAGVTATFMSPGSEGGRSPPPGGLSLVPGRRGEAHLPVGQVVRPHDDLLLALPLEGDHLVGDLVAVLVDLVVAEHRAHLELQELLAHLVGVQRVGALDRLGVDQAARVARRRVVRRLV